MKQVYAFWTQQSGVLLFGGSEVTLKDILSVTIRENSSVIIYGTDPPPRGNTNNSNQLATTLVMEVWRRGFWIEFTV